MKTPPSHTHVGSRLLLVGGDILCLAAEREKKSQACSAIRNASRATLEWGQCAGKTAHRVCECKELSVPRESPMVEGWGTHLKRRANRRSMEARLSVRSGACSGTPSAIRGTMLLHAVSARPSAQTECQMLASHARKNLQDEESANL